MNPYTMPPFSWEANPPQPDEYSEFYQGYIEEVTSPNVLQMLIEQGQKTYALIQQLSPAEASYRYAEAKWSVKEVIGHLVDTERIMAYRALCISRGETKSLPGFNQDQYVEQANFDDRSLQNLSTEYDTLRNTNISFFNSLSKKQVIRKGRADDEPVSVRALAYIIAGHERHHLNILKEKYDIDAIKNR